MCPYIFSPTSSISRLSISRVVALGLESGVGVRGSPGPKRRGFLLVSVAHALWSLLATDGLGWGSGGRALRCLLACLMPTTEIPKPPDCIHEFLVGTLVPCCRPHEDAGDICTPHCIAVNTKLQTCLRLSLPHTRQIASCICLISSTPSLVHAPVQLNLCLPPPPPRPHDPSKTVWFELSFVCKRKKTPAASA